MNITRGKLHYPMHDENAAFLPFNAAVVRQCPGELYNEEFVYSHCSSDGWQPPIEECPETPPCPEIYDQHGTVHYSDELKSASTSAWLECDHGYSDVGSSFAVCRSNGEWNTTLGPCEPIRCPQLSTRNPGVLTHNLNGRNEERAVGTKVVLRCLDDYFVEGQAEATCESNGDWSTTLGQCSPLCPDIPRNNSFVKYSVEVCAVFKKIGVVKL
ncbi:hypothetical protein AB6A40_010585 [Gnathostoma spinigerum]|uniref:Sushi domain-containing protein n=1 Tax=Gnathostoma spinigerum TaxID=75299 RepID=A0ABD6F1F0_9BILA